ncbi:MAG: GDP-L-fucose synthase [Nanoarchaeota archaeon]|nr:GDP-L-fucose synthase [Nanoarchaeota archaeon]
MQKGSFWDGKRVLLTGGSGFLGSHLAPKLEAAGTKVMIPRSRDLDLTKWENCLKATKDVDLVIHLAGIVGGIGFNRNYPGRLFYDNAIMGIQLMEAARQNNVKKFVTAGTICAYPKFTPTPFKEDYLWKGYPEETNAPYGLAKRMLLVQSQAYRQQYGFNSIFLLPVNLYGPRDNFDDERSHVIPALIKRCFNSIKNNEPEMVCWGDGSPTREFLHADDCARAIMLAAERYNSHEPINLGTGEEISIKALVELIAKHAGYEGKIEWDTSKPNGQPRRCLDTSKAKQHFGFEAKIPFEQGLKDTIDWYRENPHK